MNKEDLLKIFKNKNNRLICLILIIGVVLMAVASVDKNKKADVQPTAAVTSVEDEEKRLANILSQIDGAVLVIQLDVVELSDEVVPQFFPVGDGEVFGVLRCGADLDANDGIFDLLELVQRQPHGIPYSRGVQTGRQQIVLDVEDALGVFLVPRLSRDIADVVYPVGDGFRFCYHGSSSSSLSFLVPSGRRLSVRSLSSTPVMRSASLPSSLSHPSMNG